MPTAMLNDEPVGMVRLIGGSGMFKMMRA